MTQTNGLDVLIAWAGFAVLLGVLAYLLLRGHADPGVEAHHSDETTSRAQSRHEAGADGSR
ncbi:MAG TPA: hypothetical protein VFX33_14765 [Actinomycetales bacterium]|nr:hypothetical protein [Actinomycetales bacterium]